MKNRFGKPLEDLLCDMCKSKIGYVDEFDLNLTKIYCINCGEKE